MEGWESWDTSAKRLKGARLERGMTQQALAKASGVKQSDISKLERGTSFTTARWPQLGQALRVNAVWLSTGEGIPEGNSEAMAAAFAGTTVGHAVEVLAEALAAMSPVGRELAAGVLASIAKQPEAPEGAAAVLATLIEHHTMAPTPAPAGPPSGGKGKAKQSAHKLRSSGQVVTLTVTKGGGQKRQMSLPLRTVPDPFNRKHAPRKELEWYDKLKAAPKAKEEKK